jgi:hypothetical protein
MYLAFTIMLELEAYLYVAAGITDDLAWRADVNSLLTCISLSDLLVGCNCI